MFELFVWVMLGGIAKSEASQCQVNEIDEKQIEM